MSASFQRVLVANRGEIAVRILRTLRELDIQSVAIHSSSDGDAFHVREADVRVAIAGVSPVDAYLDAEAIVAAALSLGVDAIHPGYGFLSENAEFARRVEAAGIAFIGPRAETMELMGSKIAARAAMEAAGVPVVPGWQGSGDLIDFTNEASRIGYPVLVKAAFGGGGKGMRVVEAAEALEEAIASATREAQSAFGDGTVFLEKFIEGPRHVEVQILGDGEGGVVHLLERECSVQRRHQKVIEECPAAGITEETRRTIHLAGIRAAEAVNYRGAGTVEFLVDAQGDIHFLEMNTRLQVEHPVTEMVTGMDLVRAQIGIAEGGPLPWTQEEICVGGHAMEARIYAEDPMHGFLPAAGPVLRFQVEEGPGVRVDSGVETGDEVTVHFDPMLAKIVVHAPDRERCRARLIDALEGTVVHGFASNVHFLLHVARCDDFRDARIHTRWIEEGVPGWPPEAGFPPGEVAAALSLAVDLPVESSVSGGNGGVSREFSGPWASLGAWRGPAGEGRP